MDFNYKMVIINKESKMKYNVWVNIEEMNEKEDYYKDIKTSQVKLGSFDSLEDASVFICDLERV